MTFHIVGIGASAGGLEAIAEFFENMPHNSGMAFIVVQHLSPDYKSLMVEILSKHTQMEVLRAEEGMLVEPNKVYLIPPKKNLSIFNQRLLIEQSSSTLPNYPVDILFRSLAQDQAEKAIAIILSGTGSDGSLGIHHIKENGGIVIVQNPESAKLSGMPENAISTELVDFILTPAQMPSQLISFIDHPPVTNNNHEDLLLISPNEFDIILSILRNRNNFDFSEYRSNTILRRIERRMIMNQVTNLKDYIMILQNNPSEATVLHKEILIGVTSFFRDESAFDELQNKWLPILFSEKKDKNLRLWVVGCSTGEEAYSVAIVLKELMDKLNNYFNVKIFATDINQEAINSASVGFFPKSILGNISSERLSKYFVPKDSGFQISRDIRQMVIFAQHDIIKDPPFNNIDMITCRNMLIYMQPVLQTKVLDLLNYSLKKKGILFLGSCETSGALVEYFETLSSKWKIYSSKGRTKQIDAKRMYAKTITFPDKEKQVSINIYKDSSYMQEDKLIKRLLSILPDKYLPLTAVVGSDMTLRYLVGNSEDYFKLPAGKLEYNITKMVPKELIIPLSTGLKKVFQNEEDLSYNNIHFKSKNNTQYIKLNLKLLPHKFGEEALAAVFFEEINSDKGNNFNDVNLEYDIGRETKQHINDLEQDLLLTKETLHAAIEELETSNEELQSTNEELLASNEELQSTNEELHNVNSEYQLKIIELTELNNDFKNLLSTVQIGTLFLDENLNVRKFTAPMDNLFALDNSDIGKSIYNLKNKTTVEDLVNKFVQVHKTIKSQEIEVKTKDGIEFELKIIPYDIGQNNYSGVMITALDKTCK
ncbi:CheR/B methyltransferase-like protein [Methanococcoides burtonii DSM 6242]|uniref:CheR/B methyltransferase-like protein n=2 Tax=Methanococcoides burtonii TaxID=29291 RepID=Q12YT5_METBU|nr:CheR/B methyltransferase-like protein [Methanococcoides burtonii DSM 6242]